MKFSLFTKMAAFALLATTTAAAEEPKTKLRGPVKISTSDIESQAATSNTKVSHSHPKPQVAATDEGLPEFFPSDMTPEQVAVFKENAAQKRQNKRDKRRDIDDPNRTQEQENRERQRKTQQSNDRNNRNVDPYNGDNSSEDFGRRREAGRAAKCNRNGEGCNYSGANQDCYRDCTDNGYEASGGRVCSQYCRYMDPLCYDDCRLDGGGVVECLDDCGRNIDADTGRAADRVDCARDCLDEGEIGTRKYERCFDICDSSSSDDRRGNGNRVVDRADCARDECPSGRPGDKRFEDCMDRNCRRSGDRTIDGQRNCREDFCDGKGRPGDRSFERCMDRNCRSSLSTDE